MTSHQVVFVTCPDKMVAEHLAKGLVEQDLAACVSVLPGIQSIYRWQGKVESAQEVLLMIKTTQDRWDALLTFVQNQHPNEVPEIISLPIQQGLQTYLNWLERP